MSENLREREKTTASFLEKLRGYFRSTFFFFFLSDIARRCNLELELFSLLLLLIFLPGERGWDRFFLEELG